MPNLVEVRDRPAGVGEGLELLLSDGSTVMIDRAWVDDRAVNSLLAAFGGTVPLLSPGVSILPDRTDPASGSFPTLGTNHVLNPDAATNTNNITAFRATVARDTVNGRGATSARLDMPGTQQFERVSFETDISSGDGTSYTISGFVYSPVDIPLFDGFGGSGRGVGADLADAAGSHSDPGLYFPVYRGFNYFRKHCTVPAGWSGHLLVDIGSVNAGPTISARLWASHVACEAGDTTSNPLTNFTVIPQGNVPLDAAALSANGFWTLARIRSTLATADIERYASLAANRSPVSEQDLLQWRDSDSSLSGAVIEWYFFDQVGNSGPSWQIYAQTPAAADHGYLFFDNHPYAAGEKDTVGMHYSHSPAELALTRGGAPWKLASANAGISGQQPLVSALLGLQSQFTIGDNSDGKLSPYMDVLWKVSGRGTRPDPSQAFLASDTPPAFSQFAPENQASLRWTCANAVYETRQ